MEKIQELQGKKIAIVGLGKSWFDFALARSNGEHFDEIWVINAVANVIKHDRVFMMDPASRFLDSDDAGLQTNGMKEVLLNDLLGLFFPKKNYHQSQVFFQNVHRMLFFHK